ncbi:MAG: HEPN domain-containing protein [Planctomycetes bacterium]|nr:HEPN domain-containing protein [Planctomycetota bacterium]
MNREELQELSRIRRKEAASLLKAKHYFGAYYLLGYSVECALKACIAKQTKKYDFPNKDLLKKVYTHNLEQLVKVAGLKSDLDEDFKKNRTLEVNWATVKDWNESSRYTRQTTPADAKDFYSACTSRTNGILSWIKTKW